MTGVSMMKVVRNILLGLFLAVCFSHDCHSRSFYVESEENQDALSQQSSVGQNPMEIQEFLPGSEEILTSQGTSPVARQTLGDLLPQWQPSARIAPSLFGTRLESELSKRSSHDGWNPVKSSQSKQLRSRSQSAFRNNRGAFAKRQMILYRQCFFNPISCFHK